MRAGSTSPRRSLSPRSLRRELGTGGGLQGRDALDALLTATRRAREDGVRALQEAERNLVRFFGRRVEGVNAAAGAHDDGMNARAVLVGPTNALSRLSALSQLLEDPIYAECMAADAELSELYASGCSALGAMDGTVRRLETELYALTRCAQSSLADADDNLSSLLKKLRETEAARRDEASAHRAEVRSLERRLELAQREASERTEEAGELHAELQQMRETLARERNASEEERARHGAEKLKELERERAALDAERAALRQKMSREKGEAQAKVAQLSKERTRLEAENRLVEEKLEATVQAFATQKQAMQNKMSRMRKLQELALGIPDTDARATASPGEQARPGAPRATPPQQAVYTNEQARVRVTVPRRPPRRELYWEIMKDRLEDHLSSDQDGVLHGSRSSSTPMARATA